MYLRTGIPETGTMASSVEEKISAPDALAALNLAFTKVDRLEGKPQDIVQDGYVDMVVFEYAIIGT